MMITGTSERDLISRSRSSPSSWPSRRSRITRFGSSRTSKPASSGGRDRPDVVFPKVVHYQEQHGVVIFDNKACRLAALGTNPLARWAKHLESGSTGPTRFAARRYATMVHLQFVRCHSINRAVI